MTKQEKKKNGDDEVITAVYKAYLHCPKCAHDIQKPLLRIPGVHKVDVKSEKGEITVRGAIDAKKVHAKLQTWSKKKVELISETKFKTQTTKEQVPKKETIRTITLKAYLHCDQCEREARRRLLMHKGIYGVKTDVKAQRISVEGVIEPEKLVAYMRKKVHKYAEIVPELKKKEDKGSGGDQKKETAGISFTKVDGEGKNEVVEFKKVEAAKTKDGEIPYFVHYVYAPQLFSDENPNACSIM